MEIQIFMYMNLDHLCVLLPSRYVWISRTRHAISFCFDFHYSPSAALVDASDMDSRHPEAAQCQATNITYVGLGSVCLGNNMLGALCS